MGKEDCIELCIVSLTELIPWRALEGTGDLGHRPGSVQSLHVAPAFAGHLHADRQPRSPAHPNGGHRRLGFFTLPM